MMKLPRTLLVWGGAAALVAGGSAFMASNSVGASYAGEGSAAVSGYVVHDITYSGVTAPGGGQVGTMQYLGAPTDNNGISEQDGVSTVSFKVTPDNALWTAVQLYNSNKQVIGGGGASNCTETSGVWTCTVSSTEGYSGGVPAEEIAWIDVEAVR